MKLIKLGAGVVNQTPLDWEGNKQNIVEAIALAREQGVSVLCLPELCISGYGCEDAFLSPNTCAVAMEVLGELIAETSGLIVSFGLPVYYEKGNYNAAALVADGKLLGFAAKRFLAGDGLHYEPRWFKPWPEGHRGTVELNDIDYPIGDIVFECGDVKIGFEICEDAWVANRPGNQLAIRSVDLIMNPSASHFAFGKHEVRKRVVVEGSRAFGIAYLYTNLVGNEAGRAIYDGDAHIASGGRLLASAKRLIFAKASVTSAVVDIDANRMAQAQTSSFRPSVGIVSEANIETDFEFPSLDPEVPTSSEPLWEQNRFEKEEAFSRAIALGLFDYLRKSRSRGFVVSLSGGADSAAVSVLVALMVRFAVQELGVIGFKEKLSHIDSLKDASTVAECVSKLLLCVYQSTRNSSDVTRNAARAVAKAIHANYLELDVDSLVESYTTLIEASIGRKLTWTDDDVALQNIQARVRGPSVWMLANIRSSLLLATSNRSEAAVGYATMDGDTCGGLSPIAGIDKAFLRRWLAWMEKHGPQGASPLPELSAVTAQQPTAELRPPAAEQTDEGDLMPYELLDAIEGSAIRDKHSPLEVLREMKAQFPTYDLPALGVYVERFFRLWCRNQWKRERYAPSFHVDDKNLDPKTWCRFPILSGGFRRELEQMNSYIRGRK